MELQQIILDAKTIMKGIGSIAFQAIKSYFFTNNVSISYIQ